MKEYGQFKLINEEQRTSKKEWVLKHYKSHLTNDVAKNLEIGYKEMGKINLEFAESDLESDVYELQVYESLLEEDEF